MWITLFLVLFFYFKQHVIPEILVGVLVAKVQDLSKGYQSHFIECDFLTTPPLIKGAAFFGVNNIWRNDMKKYSDVGIDNIHGGYLAGKYLLDMGHTKIMYMANVDEDCDHDRYLGLTGAYKEKGLSWRDEDFKLLSPLKEERYKRYEVIFSEIHNYTAAFMASDVLAIEFMNFLQDKGMVIPEDFSIVGFDDIPMAACIRPRLTTISQNIKVRSEKAVSLLMELMEGRTEGRQELLSLELVVRDSVKKIK